MKKLIYGIIIALFCSGCDDFLKEYSQSQTVAKEVSHFDEVLLGDGYLPAQNRAYISTDHAGFLNVMDDDVTTVGSQIPAEMQIDNCGTDCGWIWIFGWKNA